jgi:OmpA-OmpF porin, OOP family
MKNVKWLGRLGAVATLTGLLTSCAHMDIDDLKKAEQKGHEFTQNLTKEYLDFAMRETDKYNDQLDASHFAVKGIQAAAGLHVLPENPDVWGIADQGALGELHKYRERLMFALHKSGKVIDPALAAQAVVLFDCWVEEQAEGWQPENIAKCRDGFMTALKKLEESVRTEAPTFMIWFALNSATLTPEGQEEIDQIMKVAKHLTHHKFVIHCVTDGIGGRAFNLKLSQDRAETVKAAVLKAGLDASRIESAVGLGEAEGTLEIKPFDRRCDIHLH